MLLPYDKMKLSTKSEGRLPSSWGLQKRRRQKVIERAFTITSAFFLCLLFLKKRGFDLPLHKCDQTVLNGCAVLKSDADNARTFVDISFEEATQDDALLGWEEDWVAFGKLPHVEPSLSLGGRTKFDAVVSWVNGSEDTFAELREQHATTSHLNQPGTDWLHNSLARHREWSQVQWAALSCLKNIKNLNRVKLLTSHDQVPEYPDVSEEDRDKLLHGVDHVNDASLFEPENRKCVIPTFNSVAIEVNMGAMKSDVDKFLYLCDDMLLTTEYRDADLYTPLFGLSMIIYDALVWNVDEDEPYDANQPSRGEYPEYHHSSALFNHAFGKRNRAYVRHATKVYSRKLLREVRDAFPAAYADASLSKFRGDRQIINPHFHAHHYVIERHRKALLWSFLKLKSDTDGDGEFSWTERKALKDLLHSIDRDEPQGVTRKTTKSMKKDLSAAGFDAAHALKPKWSSFDGPTYSFFEETAIERNPVFHEYKTEVPDKPKLDFRCELDYDVCFGADFFTKRDAPQQPSVNKMLDRFARQNPRCGDCLINKLVLASGEKGLNAFLPGAEYPDQRNLAVKAIMRYSYTKNKLLGNMIVLGPSTYDLDMLKYKLELMTQGHEAMPAQMCVNDDVPMDTPGERVDEIRQHLTTFYRDILDGVFVKDPKKTQAVPVMPKQSDYL